MLFISIVWVPDPCAIRFLRDGLRSVGRALSFCVIELMMASNFFREVSSMILDAAGMLAPPGIFF